MGKITEGFNRVFRDFETDGVSSSEPHVPTRSELRSLGALIEAALGAPNGNVDAGKSIGALRGIVAALAQPVVEAAADSAAIAAGAVQALTSARQSMIDGGLALTQNEGDAAVTGFLMTSITSPEVRRTITRTTNVVTVATTLGIVAGVLFQEVDQAGGRLYSADFRFTAGASTRDVGLGCTAHSRAETARADASETTAVAVDTADANDTRLIGLRSSGTVQCDLQSAASVMVTANSQIAANSFTAAPAPYTNDEVIRCTAYVPDDDTSDRRLDWYIQTAGVGPFVWVGYATVAASFWPQGAEVWAGANSVGAFTIEISNRTVKAAGGDPVPVRYMDGAAALVGLGTRTEPVSDLEQLFTSVDEATDTLTAYISANGGAPYRITRSNGLSLAWTRFREIRLIGEAGAARPDIRGSMPPPDAWTRVSGEVWKTANYFGNQAVTSNGGVVCYDCAGISGFATPGANVRWLYNAGPNAATEALQALSMPAYAANADGSMYIVLPGGEDPNDLALELAQCATMMTFAGPDAALSLYRPKLIMQGINWGGSNQAALRMQLWDLDLELCDLRGTGVEPLLLEECGGRTAMLRVLGSGGDGIKWNPYTGAGGTHFYDEASRPSMIHWDLEALAAGHAGLSNADNVSSHPKGGFQYFHGGRFLDATKHNMSMTEAFEAHGVDCRRGAQGGITAAFDAARDGRFLIGESYIEDAGVAAIQMTRQSGAGITTGVIRGTRIAAPNVATPIGIAVYNSGTAAQVVLDDIDNRIDTAIATARSGYAAASVTQRSYA